MPCQILIGNRAGNKGELISVAASDHVWSYNETLSAWKLKFPDRDISEYHRSFTLVLVSDKDPQDLEYLGELIPFEEPPFIDPNIDPLIEPIEELAESRWSFIEPEVGSALWNELLTTGQVTVPWAGVVPYIKDNIV